MFGPGSQSQPLRIWIVIRDLNFRLTVHAQQLQIPWLFCCFKLPNPCPNHSKGPSCHMPHNRCTMASSADSLTSVAHPTSRSMSHRNLQCIYRWYPPRRQGPRSYLSCQPVSAMRLAMEVLVEVLSVVIPVVVGVDQSSGGDRSSGDCRPRVYKLVMIGHLVVVVSWALA